MDILTIKSSSKSGTMGSIIIGDGKYVTSDGVEHTYNIASSTDGVENGYEITSSVTSLEPQFMERDKDANGKPIVNEWLKINFADGSAISSSALTKIFPKSKPNDVSETEYKRGKKQYEALVKAVGDKRILVKSTNALYNLPVDALKGAISYVVTLPFPNDSVRKYVVWTTKAIPAAELKKIFGDNAE